MKTINIAGSIKELMIFDDPEYCHDDKAECPRMGDNYESASCCFFLDKDNDPVDLYYDWDAKLFKKLPQCKEAYQKAKALTSIKNLVDNQQDLPPEFSKSVDKLFRDESGKSYIDPMHPERGTV